MTSAASPGMGIAGASSCFLFTACTWIQQVTRGTRCRGGILIGFGMGWPFVLLLKHFFDSLSFSGANTVSLLIVFFFFFEFPIQV